MAYERHMVEYEEKSKSATLSIPFNFQISAGQTTGQQRALFIKRVTPPQPKYTQIDVWVGFVLILFVVFIAAWQACGAAPTTALVVTMVLGVLGFIPYHTQTNRILGEHIMAIHKWKRTWVCLSCGHTWEQ